MVKKVKKKKRHVIRFLLLIFLLAVSVYLGKMLAEYTWGNNKDDLINKYAKPIGDIKSSLEGAAGEGNISSGDIIPENDIVTLTALTTEFIAAEHMKRTDKLAALVDGDYYGTLLKKINSLKTAEASVTDMNFQKISKDTVKVAVKYTIGTKSYSESISLRFSDKKWKVIEVDK